MKQYKFTGKTVMRFSIMHSGRIMDCCAEPGKCLALPSDNATVKSYLAKGIFVETENSVSVSAPVSSESVENSDLNTRGDSEIAFSSDAGEEGTDMVDFKVTKKYFYKNRAALEAAGIKVGDIIKIPAEKQN